jgi:hypothetical protein
MRTLDLKNWSCGKKSGYSKKKQEDFLLKKSSGLLIRQFAVPVLLIH